MGRFAVLLCGLLAAAALLPTSARAATVAWLYEVDVPVTDQSADVRAAASRQALLIVLKRVSGLADVPMDATVTGALQSPQRYFTQYRYRTDTTGAAASNQLVLSVRFAETAVRKLVSDAGLPFWSSNRPTTLALIAVDEGGSRVVLGTSDTHALLTGLRDRASERGLPLLLPSMDAQERSDASSASLWSGNAALLERTAATYGAERILLGRVVHGPSGAWRAEWQLSAGADRQAFDLESSSAEAAGAGIVDRLTDALVVRYAVRDAVSQRLPLQVDGIGSVAQYGALLTYLHGLEFVDSVQVEEVRPNVVLLALATRTPWERMRDLLALDGRLEPSDAPAAPDRRVVVWRGDGRR
jgi:hypothetical protein